MRPTEGLKRDWRSGVERTDIVKGCFCYSDQTLPWNTMSAKLKRVKGLKVLGVHSFSLPFRRRGVMMRMPGTHLQTLHHLAQRKTNWGVTGMLRHLRFRANRMRWKPHWKPPHLPMRHLQNSHSLFPMGLEHLWVLQLQVLFLAIFSEHASVHGLTLNSSGFISFPVNLFKGDSDEALRKQREEIIEKLQRSLGHIHVWVSFGDRQPSASIYFSTGSDMFRFWVISLNFLQRLKEKKNNMESMAKLAPAKEVEGLLFGHLKIIYDMICMICFEFLVNIHLLHVVFYLIHLLLLLGRTRMFGQCRNPATARYQHSTRAIAREWSCYSIPRYVFISKTCTLSELERNGWGDRWIWGQWYHIQRNDRKSWVREEGKHLEAWHGEGEFHGCWGWGHEWFGKVNRDEFDKEMTIEHGMNVTHCFCLTQPTVLLGPHFFTPIMLPTLCFCRLVTTMLDDRINSIAGLLTGGVEEREEAGEEVQVTQTSMTSQLAMIQSLWRKAKMVIPKKKEKLLHPRPARPVMKSFGLRRCGRNGTSGKEETSGMRNGTTTTGGWTGDSQGKLLIGMPF